jgi:hypothetical protein
VNRRRQDSAEVCIPPCNRDRGDLLQLFSHVLLFQTIYAPRYSTLSRQPSAVVTV